jgi:hypothetical protein
MKDAYFFVLCGVCGYEVWQSCLWCISMVSSMVTVIYSTVCRSFISLTGSSGKTFVTRTMPFASAMDDA